MSRAPQRPSGSAPIERSGLMTRRAALKAMLGITAVTAGLVSRPLRAIAAEASRETTNAHNSAQAQLDEAQKKLDAISDEYVSLNEQLNDTVSQIEQVQASIDDTQSQIDAKQAEIADKQDVLAGRISSSYKTGGTDFLSVLLNSSSFEELTNNLYYMGKINASDEQLIDDVKRAKAELDSQKAQLESQKSDLEQLKEQQSQELAAVQAKQDEASSIVANLSDDVRALMEKRDAEILAAAEPGSSRRGRAQGGRSRVLQPRQLGRQRNRELGQRQLQGPGHRERLLPRGVARLRPVRHVGLAGLQRRRLRLPRRQRQQHVLELLHELQQGRPAARHDRGRVHVDGDLRRPRLRARGHLHRRRHGHAQRRLHPDHGARHLDQHLRHHGHPALGLGRLAPIEHQGPLAIRSGRPFSCGASQTQQSPHRHPNQPRHSIMEGWYGRG